MITNKSNKHSSLISLFGLFSIRSWRHVLNNGGATHGLALHLGFAVVGYVRHWFLLRLGVLAEGAEERDLLPLTASRDRLAGRLEQVDGLAGLLYRSKHSWRIR